MRSREPLLSLLLVGSLVLGGCLGSQSGDVQGAIATSADPSLPLEAGFLVDPPSGLPGQSIRFTDRSNGPVVERAWDFGDGTASTERDPVHQYATAAAYRVTLRVKDAEGGQSQTSQFVAIRIPGKTDTPTGPAGPGLPTGFLTFGSPSTVISSNGGEPSLAIDSKGTFWVSPPGNLFKSTDGKAWTSVNYPAPISGDSHVLIDKDDRVYVADLQGGGLGAGIGIFGPSSVWASSDGGASWGTGSPAASILPLNDRQWLASPGGNTVYLLYRFCTVPTPIGCLTLVESFLVKSTDGGRTWAPATTRGFAWTSYPFADPRDGTLYIVQSSNQGMDVAVTKDGGATWEQKNVVARSTSTANLFVNGAVDAAGNVYITWADNDRGQSDVYMAYSTNQGKNWKGPFLVSPSVGTHIMPWIAAGGDGKVVVAWYASPTKGTADTLDASAKWYVTVAQSLNAHDAAPVFAESRASADAIHVGAVCTSGLACTGDRDLADFFTVQIGPDGKAAVAYSQDGATSTTRTLFVLQNGGPSNR